MSKRGTKVAADKFQSIEDAIVDGLMNASSEELRDELAACGENVSFYLAKVDAVIAEAQARVKKGRLARARAELESVRSTIQPKTAGLSRDELLTRFKRLQAQAPTDTEFSEKMMMAARKGEGMSDADLEGMLDDLEALIQLDRDKEKK